MPMIARLKRLKEALEARKEVREGPADAVMFWAASAAGETGELVHHQISTIGGRKKALVEFAWLCHSTLAQSDEARTLCVAIAEDGKPCGQHAPFLDFQRGGMVCEKHRPASKNDWFDLEAAAAAFSGPPPGADSGVAPGSGR